MSKTEEVHASFANRGSEILEILRSNKSPVIMREQLEDYHENDIAEVLSELTLTERKKLYRILTTDKLSEILPYVDDAGQIVEEMDIRSAVNVIARMEPDDAVDTLRQISKYKREALIDLLDTDTRKDIALIASFDEDEIGSKMTTDYVEMPISLTAEEAMKSLSRQAQKTDNISTIYILSDDQTFYGAVPLKDLIIASPRDTVSDLCLTSFPYVYAQEQISECIDKMRDYSEDSIPVLDHQNRVLGIVTAQDLIEVTEQEMGEDYARLAGLIAENDLKESVMESAKKRLPWLIILLGLGLVVSSVVGLFESVVAALPLVMGFQSLILDMAGNAGTQSLAVTIRVLTDETMPWKVRMKLVPREIRVAAFNGLIMAVLAYLFITVYLFFGKAQPIQISLLISGCISLSLVVAMIFSGLFGTLIPMFFKKIHVDPAAASGPLITTINDLIAVVIYYGLVWVLLLNTLHIA